MSLFRYVLVLLLSSCYRSDVGNSTNSNLYSAYDSAKSHAELTVTGRVTRVLGLRQGRSGVHEGFLLLVPYGCSPGSQGGCRRQITVRVEDNVSITGSVPLHRGEVVSVHGQYEYYPQGGVIHWTHHDPSGRHENGYIEAGGKRYQ